MGGPETLLERGFQARRSREDPVRIRRGRGEREGQTLPSRLEDMLTVVWRILRSTKQNFCRVRSSAVQWIWLRVFLLSRVDSPEVACGNCVDDSNLTTDSIIDDKIVARCGEFLQDAANLRWVGQ